jgi:hypothetical protein
MIMATKKKAPKKPMGPAGPKPAKGAPFPGAKPFKKKGK